MKDRLRRWVLAGAYGYTHLHPCGPTASAAARLLSLLPPIRRLATHKMGACMVPFRQQGRLLDVGCGSGEYLHKMHGYGWEVSGIEPDAAAGRVAREQYGLELFSGLVEDAPYPASSFDMITARHVIEHIGDPRSFLVGVCRLLKPGGRLVLLTPNGGGLGHRLFRADFYSLDPPRHLVLYTPTGLRHLVQQVPGIRLISLRTPARIARKIARHYQVVRRDGSFRAPTSGASMTEKAGAALFHNVEAVAAALRPVGEEIELVAEKL
jgi:2-polyprenyl-3-methyl-5-hydroxy-6-metoxy-1,4-benzoquinol methylase